MGTNLLKVVPLLNQSTIANGLICHWGQCRSVGGAWCHFSRLESSSHLWIPAEEILAGFGKAAQQIQPHVVKPGLAKLAISG